MSLQPVVAAHLARSRTKSPERLAVEQVLRHAPAPLSQRAIAERSNLPAADVNRVITTMLNAGAVHRNQDRPAGYTLGAAPAPAVDASHFIPQGTYSGRELLPYTGRAGAMDAFNLPSLQNGRRTPRVAPCLIASTKPDPRRL